MRQVNSAEQFVVEKSRNRYGGGRVGALISVGLGLFAVVNGYKAIGCQSVSFARYGSTCYVDSAEGAVPGWAAAVLLCGVGVVLLARGVLAFRQR